MESLEFDPATETFTVTFDPTVIDLNDVFKTVEAHGRRLNRSYRPQLVTPAG